MQKPEELPDQTNGTVPKQYPGPSDTNNPVPPGTTQQSGPPEAKTRTDRNPPERPANRHPKKHP